MPETRLKKKLKKKAPEKKAQPPTFGMDATSQGEKVSNYNARMKAMGDEALGIKPAETKARSKPIERR